jgi:subtilisin family serine protease
MGCPFIRPRLMLSMLLAALVVPLFAPAVLGPAVLADDAEGVAAVHAAVPGRLIVAFPNRYVSEAEVQAVLGRHGLVLERWLPELRLARAVVRAGAEAAAAGVLSQDAAIDYATQERLSVELADAPQDEYWGQQWGPAKAGLPAARDLAWGDPSTVIAVIDTGVSYWHWDLREQVWFNPGESEVDLSTGTRTCDGGIAINGQDDDNNGYPDDCRGYNFDSGDNDPTDLHGHGTAVAGIAAAATNNPGHYTNGKLEGIAGMGGSARLMTLRAMNASGTGSPFNIAEAIRYAADEGAHVINLSLTLAVYYDPADAETLCRATDYAQGLGSLIVAASGNHSSSTGIQPVSIPASAGS